MPFLLGRKARKPTTLSGTLTAGDTLDLILGHRVRDGLWVADGVRTLPGKARLPVRALVFTTELGEDPVRDLLLHPPTSRRIIPACYEVLVTSSGSQHPMVLLPSFPFDPRGIGRLKRADDEQVAELLIEAYPRRSSWRRATEVQPLGVYGFLRCNDRLHMITLDHRIRLPWPDARFEHLTRRVFGEALSQHQFFTEFLSGDTPAPGRSSPPRS